METIKKYITNNNEIKKNLLKAIEPNFQKPNLFNNIPSNLSTKIENVVEEMDLSDTVTPSKVQSEEAESLAVSNTYISSNLNTDIYQSKLKETLEKATGTRNKTVAAAIFLATEFPKLPYFWGGGHECPIEDLVGINSKWGNPEKIIFGGDDYYTVGDEFPYSLDCSGFITWCLKNGGYNIENCLGSSDCQELGPSTSITSPEVLGTAKIGDIGWMPGHVGMIVDINKDTNEITFAHISGSGYGMGLTTISTKTGKITKDEQGALPKTDKNNDPITDYKERVGEEYFKEIISLPYPD